MTEDVRTDLLERLLAAHGSHYDILRDYLFEGRVFSAFAEYHSFGAQFVLVKRAKLWEANVHEFLFFDVVNSFNEEDLEVAKNFMMEKAFRKVAAGTNHMSSAVTLVVIAHSVSDGAAEKLRKVSYRKNYKLGFHGWADLRLAVVDTSRPYNEAVFVNTAAKNLKTTIEQNFKLVIEKQERAQN